MKKIIKLLTLATALGSSLAAGESLFYEIFNFNGDIERIKQTIEEDKMCLYEVADHFGTPLHCAVALALADGAIEITKTLLDHGAYLEAKDKSGVTPLHKAVSFSGTPEMVQLLLDRGAKVNAHTGNCIQLTALHLAANEGRTEIIKLLLRNGADVNACTKLGQRPIDYARSKKHRAAVKILHKAERRPQGTDEEAPRKKRRHAKAQKSSKKRITS